MAAAFEFEDNRIGLAGEKVVMAENRIGVYPCCKFVRLNYTEDNPMEEDEFKKVLNDMDQWYLDEMPVQPWLGCLSFLTLGFALVPLYFLYTEPQTTTAQILFVVGLFCSVLSVCMYICGAIATNRVVPAKLYDVNRSLKGKLTFEAEEITFGTMFKVKALKTVKPLIADREPSGEEFEMKLADQTPGNESDAHVNYSADVYLHC